MSHHNRREFLTHVGRGMIVASVGYGAACDMGFTSAWAEPASDGLNFGKREPLVRLMQETPPEKLSQLLLEQYRNGTELRELIAAGALANARSFGGEDYIGFHTFMAMLPALRMADELSSDERPLPVLKVLYRNSSRLQATGGGSQPVLKPLPPADDGAKRTETAVQQAVLARDMVRAEQALSAAARVSPETAFNDLLLAVDDGAEVHRVVLAYRSWDMLDVVGKDLASTMLRQSVHYCVKNEEGSRPGYTALRALLPKLFDQHKLIGREIGARSADDAWMEKFTQTIFQATPEQAADAAAAALAEGFAPSTVAEAIGLVANQLVLRDSGRSEREVQPNKQLGSVHGDSIGVHACDSAHAWRNIARASNPRNAQAATILSAWQVARDRVSRGGKFLEWPQRPLAEQLDKVPAGDAETLLRALDGAIREKDQERTCAVAERYARQGYADKPLRALLLKYATSEDGALHAEKFFATASDEFSTTRAAFRWRHLVALARVTASEFGQPAPGYAEARKLLKLA